MSAFALRRKFLKQENVPADRETGSEPVSQATPPHRSNTESKKPSGSHGTSEIVSEDHLPARETNPKDVLPDKY